MGKEVSSVECPLDSASNVSPRWAAVLLPGSQNMGGVMRKHYLWLAVALLALLFLALAGGRNVASQTTSSLEKCKDFAYSTEEDFLTQGPKPPDGNALISDGDLLGRFATVCLRNRELLRPWEQNIDLGLDAVDVLSVDKELVSFSTELDDPAGRFKAGDLLSTWGTAIPNRSLLIRFQISRDLGLDGIQWIGDIDDIIAFHDFARDIPRARWLEEPGLFVTELQRYKIDLWFTVEGTERRASTVPVYDGDVLSAAGGIIVYGNGDLLPASVPAGLPDRGVDFGLDALAMPRTTEIKDGRFSTEILFRGKPAFTDGDILKLGDGIDIVDKDLYGPWEPLADFLGTDALHVSFEAPPRPSDDFLPMILHFVRELME